MAGHIENLTRHTVLGNLRSWPSFGQAGCTRPCIEVSSSCSRSVILWFLPSNPLLNPQPQPVFLFFLEPLQEAEAWDTLLMKAVSEKHWVPQSNLCSLSLNQSPCSATEPTCSVFSYWYSRSSSSACSCCSCEHHLWVACGFPDSTSECLGNVSEFLLCSLSLLLSSMCCSTMNSMLSHACFLMCQLLFLSVGVDHSCP